MFDPKTSLSDRFADSLDLVIDFATLGEYGLEPVGPNPRAPHPCDGDRRTVRPSAPKRRTRGPRPTSARPRGPQPPLRGQSDLWSQMTRRSSRIPSTVPTPARGAAAQRHASDPTVA
jgi:hypothetical protein